VPGLVAVAVVESESRLAEAVGLASFEKREIHYLFIII